jgi:hypothetical protein
MIYTHDLLTPNPQYPIYPPYHNGLYLEDYFRERFKAESPIISRYYIGISWTTLYCDNKHNIIQSFLDYLPKDRKYFTVSQHDDAPAHRLPPDTLCFSAGGNARVPNIIPIPLVCSPIPIDLPDFKLWKRTHLASFVGSNTHPIRIEMAEACKNDSDIVIKMKGWSPSVSDTDFNSFLSLAVESTFCLCPRGYGLNSFRLYEAMQLGCIPVIITDEPYLPWNDELNWNEFSVLITKDKISNMVEILRSYNINDIQIMRDKIKEIYPKYFTMDGMYENILRRL